MISNEINLDDLINISKMTHEIELSFFYLEGEYQSPKLLSNIQIQ